MKVKGIVIYKWDTKGATPFEWNSEFTKLLEEGKLTPFQQFAVLDKPKSFLDHILGKK